MTLSRRQMLMAAGASLLAPEAVSRGFARPQGANKKILFFTKSSGFQHSVITRKDGQLGHAERILTEIGKSHGFDVVASKNGRLFNPDQIGQWDGFAFYTTGDLTTPGNHKDGEPMTADGFKAFMDAIASGKGLVGFHCATDTFHSKGDEIHPYIRLIGGEFSGHGAQQVATIRIADESFPGVKEFGSGSFQLIDEWYGQKNLNDDLHVILIQETQGMTGKDYERPPYPMTWTRMQNKGRVFYTAMGHREDVWENPKFQGLAIAGLAFITGKVDASTEPNVARVTPGYKDVPKK